MSAAGVAIVLAAGLVGCSDDDDAAADPPPESTSTATEEAGGDETDAAEQVPELPPEAQGDDDAAAVAFVEHWVELVNYAITTGDTEPLTLAQSPDCVTCGALVDSLSTSETSDGIWSTRDASSRPPTESEPGDRVVTTDIRVDGSTPDPFGNMTLGLLRAGDAWRVEWLLSENY